MLLMKLIWQNICQYFHCKGVFSWGSNETHSSYFSFQNLHVFKCSVVTLITSSSGTLWSPGSLQDLKFTNCDSDSRVKSLKSFFLLKLFTATTKDPPGQGQEVPQGPRRTGEQWNWCQSQVDTRTRAVCPLCGNQRPCFRRNTLSLDHSSVEIV